MIETPLAELFTDFEFEELLGSGGYGSVYLVKNRKLKRHEALKILNSTLSEDRISTLRSEAETISSLCNPRHPGIPIIYDVFEKNGRVAFTSEYIEGKSLSQVIKEIYLCGEEIPKGFAYSIVRQIAAALRHAHELGVVHRDIKPSNIVMNREGLVQVIDFGIAQLSQKLNGRPVGSLPYMPLEQIAGGGDERIDVYALGVLFFELLTGTTPWVQEGSGEEEILKRKKSPDLHIPSEARLEKELESIIRKATAAHPDLRYQSIGEFEHALHSYALTMQRRRFLAILSSALLAGTGGFSLLNYVHYLGSLDYALQTVGRATPQERPALYRELYERIIQKKIIPLGKKFPNNLPYYIPKDKREYQPAGVVNWSAGFGPALLWKAFKKTGEETVRNAAENWTRRMYFSEKDELGIHAFRFFNAHAPAYEITGEEAYLKTALKGADLLLKRYNPWGECFQVSGEVTSTAEHDVRVDTLLFTPFFLWAYRKTYNRSYLDAVCNNARTIMASNRLPDQSFLQVSLYDHRQRKRIAALRGLGYSEESCLSRGQARCILGFAELYAATHDHDFLEAAIDAADYFIRSLPRDGVPYYDFKDPRIGKPQDSAKIFTFPLARDASAAVIGVKGLLLLAGLSKNPLYRERALTTLATVITDDFSAQETYEGLISHCCADVQTGPYANCSLIYVDYHFMEILEEEMKK